MVDGRAPAERPLSFEPALGALVQWLRDNLGLISSADAGNTWEVVSELGESDFHILQATGDHVVAGRALFGSCRWICAELLPRFGVEVTSSPDPS